MIVLHYCKKLFGLRQRLFLWWCYVVGWYLHGVMFLSVYWLLRDVIVRTTCTHTVYLETDSC